VTEIYFLDSSALVKRYVSERGTAWVNALTTAPVTELYIAQVTGVEVVAAMARRLPERQAHTAIAAFRADFITGFAVIRMTDDVVERAMTMAMKHKLRGYDALQLAAAMALLELAAPRAVTLAASDAELLRAGKTEGFVVADPNDYL